VLDEADAGQHLAASARALATAAQPASDSEAVLKVHGHPIH
jgi:hypothetical protein